MKNWIFYKDKKPVNLNNVASIRGAKGYGYKPNSILFFCTNKDVEWDFDYETERNLVYQSIKSQMTEIKIDYHPDLDKDKIEKQ